MYCPINVDNDAYDQSVHDFVLPSNVLETPDDTTFALSN